MRRCQDAHLAEKQSASSLAKELAGKQAALSQLENALQQLPIATAQHVSQLKASIAELDVRLRRPKGGAAICSQRRSPGGSPLSRPGSASSPEPKIPALSIVPNGDILDAELLMPPRAIGFVAPGQTVQISYDTFPFTQFGFAHGAVRTVSHTLLKPDEIVGPVILRKPFYRVGVALE
jgi:membrane fusion protein